MIKNEKTFFQIIEEAKLKIQELNISFEEIELNTGVDSEFMRILFDPTTNTAKNISELLQFLAIAMRTRHKNVKRYVITSNGSQLRIKRAIKPICTMYYDRKKDDFFRFKYKLKENKPSKVYTDIIKNEMKDLIFRYLAKEDINNS